MVVPNGPAGTYSFRDLVALRVVVSLLAAGVPMIRVRTALRVLSASGDDLAGLRIVTDGVSVFACHDDGQILDALRNGQLALFVAIDRFAAALDADVRAFTAERDAFVDHLHGNDAGIDVRDAIATSAASDRDDGEGVVGVAVVSGIRSRR